METKENDIKRFKEHGFYQSLADERIVYEFESAGNIFASFSVWQRLDAWNGRGFAILTNIGGYDYAYCGLKLVRMGYDCGRRCQTGGKLPVLAALPAMAN